MEFKVRSETENMSDSQYMEVVKNYQDRHKEQMDEIYKMCHKKEQPKTFWQKLKSLLGF